jgi:WD40 repeat protein
MLEKEKPLMKTGVGNLFVFAVLIAIVLVIGSDGAATRARGGDPARTDQFGGPLPKDALVRLGTMRFRVEGGVSSVAFSPDGKRLAAGDWCGLVYLWEAATGKVIRQLDAREQNPVVFFSKDGMALATRTVQGEVRLWDDSGRRQASVQRRAGEYYRYDAQLLLSPDRPRLIVVGDANAMIAVHNGKHADAYVIGDKLPELSIDLLELPSGKLVKQLAKAAPETIFSDAALSPDGKLLAVGIRAYKAPRKLLRLIDAASGELVREIKGDQEGWFLSMAFSRDGNTLALGSKDEIALADVATGKILDRLTAKMTTVAFLGFSPDAKTLVSHSHDNKVRLWDLVAKKVLRQFDAEADGHSVLPLPGRLGDAAQHVEHFSKSIGTALSPDGKTVAVSVYGCVQLWDAVAGKQLFPDQIPADGWGKVSFSPDGRLLLAGNWKHSHLWDSVSGEVRQELPAGTAWGVFSPDGKQLAFARYPRDEDKEAPAVSIWDIAAGKELFKLEHPRKERFVFEKLAFGSDGRTLLTLSTHVEDAGYPNCAMVHRWDIRTRKLLGSIHRGNANAWPSVIAADGRTAAIVLDRGLLLTDVENDEDLWTKADGTPEGWSGYPVFSPDGGFLFVRSTDGHVGMWEIATRSVIARLRLHRDGNIKLAKWPMPDKDSKGEREMTFDQADIEALTVSPDGRFVATSERFDDRRHRASSDKPTPLPVIRIWEAATGKEVQRLEGFRSRSTSLAFSPDGRRLASAFHNDTVLVWDVSRTARPARPRKKLTPHQLEKLWGDLALADGAGAYRAITALQEAPEEAVDFLTQHVRPVPAADAKRIHRLIQGLGSERFAERDGSAKELMTLTARFRTTLRKALREPASVEVKRRLATILSEAPRQLPPDSLRRLRSIQTLERIGSAEAGRLLSVLSEGAPEAHETLAAQTALQRLTMRSKNAQ